MVVVMLSAPALAQSSKDWVDIKNAKELRALYSNKTFRGKGPDGTPFVGHYRSDGKGILIVGGQRTPRTWEVKGNDQVCVTDEKATNCWRAQRHKKNSNEIVLQHVTAGWISQFTVEDGIPQF
jgi:hypothetical protein